MRIILKRILKKIGVFDKFFVDRMKSSKFKTKKINIEFLGATGVGKTTIYNEVLSKTVGSWNYIINQRTQPIGNFNAQMHWRLLLMKMKNLESNEQDHFVNIRLMDYYTSIIYNDILMLYDKSFFIEEGICHNFLDELIAFSDEDFQKIMHCRALILILPRNYQTVVNNIRNRQQEGGHMALHNIGKSDARLLEITEEAVGKYNMLVNRAEQIGIPICRICTEDDMKEKINQILMFEQRFIDFNN